MPLILLIILYIITLQMFTGKEEIYQRQNQSNDVILLISRLGSWSVSVFFFLIKKNVTIKTKLIISFILLKSLFTNQLLVKHYLFGKVVDFVDKLRTILYLTAAHIIIYYGKSFTAIGCLFILGTCTMYILYIQLRVRKFDFECSSYYIYIILPILSVDKHLPLAMISLAYSITISFLTTVRFKLKLCQQHWLT